jgi:predicted RNA-binding Zn-ribbon protein involved in translation (DUF1610 family)
MGKSSQEKIEFALNLLSKNVPYREIQDKLKERFGGGMSNTTLKNIQKYQKSPQQLEKKILQLEQELDIFKEMYFLLAEAVVASISDKNLNKCPTCGALLKNNLKIMLFKMKSAPCPECGNKIEFV